MSLKICANLLSRKDILKHPRGNESSFVTAFNLLLLTASRPVALFGFKSLIRVSISLAKQLIVDSSDIQPFPYQNNNKLYFRQQ